MGKVKKEEEEGHKHVIERGENGRRVGEWRVKGKGPVVPLQPRATKFDLRFSFPALQPFLPLPLPHTLFFSFLFTFLPNNTKFLPNNPEFFFIVVRCIAKEQPPLESPKMGFLIHPPLSRRIPRNPNVTISHFPFFHYYKMQCIFLLYSNL